MVKGLQKVHMRFALERSYNVVRRNVGVGCLACSLQLYGMLAKLGVALSP